MISLSRMACDARSATQPHILKAGPRTSVLGARSADGYFHEIASGSVMLYKIHPHGRRQIFDVLETGDFYGVAPGMSRDCSAQTLCDTVLVRHQRAALASDAGLQARVTENLLARQQVLHAHMQLLGTPSAAERITGLLMMQRDHCRHLPLSITEIADYLGLRTETVSRQFARLAKAGIVARSRWGSYVVKDADGLRKCASAD